MFWIFATHSSCRADGVTEVIEAGDKILGTQFHPDVDDMPPEVFEWLAK